MSLYVEITKFALWYYKGIQLIDWIASKKILWAFKESWDCDRLLDYRDVWRWTKCIFHCNMDIKLWGPSAKMQWFRWHISHSLRNLNTWSTISDAVWGKELWFWWREYAIRGNRPWSFKTYASFQCVYFASFLWSKMVALTFCPDCHACSLLSLLHIMNSEFLGT